MNPRSILAGGCVLALLAGCGTNEKDRVQGGAATGAATGATIGLVGGPIGVVVGGVIGGGVGAVTGASTDSKDLNLGKPIWANPEARIPAPGGPIAPAQNRS
jgi:osmotically inducible lipoprotein OsmB